MSVVYSSPSGSDGFLCTIFLQRKFPATTHIIDFVDVGNKYRNILRRRNDKYDLHRSFVDEVLQQIDKQPTRWGVETDERTFENQYFRCGEQ